MFHYEIYNYYRVWAGQAVEGIEQLMPMWLEMVVGFIVLAVCAFLSYLLVCYQRKRVQVEEASVE